MRLGIEESGTLRRAGLLAASLGLLAAFPAPVQAQVDTARNRGAAWLLLNQRGDGSWANADGELTVQATSATLMAMQNAGLAKTPSFGSGAAWLANAGADSIDSISRKIEALSVASVRGVAQTEADRLYGLRAQSFSAVWGGYGGSGVDNIDTALGLSALRVGDASYSTKAASPSNNTIIGAMCALASQRVLVAAGKQAWPATQVSSGQSAGQGRPSLVASALLLGELRAVQLRTGFSGFSCPTAYTLPTLLSEAQAWLLDQQNADGGFGEQRTDGSRGGSSVMATAWVLRALNAQAAPPATAVNNARNWLLAQQDGTTGSWRFDAMVTAAVVSVLPAAAGAQLTDTDRDGITDVVEQQMPGYNPVVADARKPLQPPSLSMPGLTMSAFNAAATVGQAFSNAVGSGSGYTLSLGSLPPGLTLNSATGVISGTPLQAGNYSFEFSRAVAAGSDTLIGRIDVSSAADGGANDGEVPLPPWALGLLGAGLAVMLRRHLRPRT